MPLYARWATTCLADSVCWSVALASDAGLKARFHSASPARSQSSGLLHWLSGNWGEVTLILCMQDSATAKKLAFHKDVHTRCITLEGDDFNPGGLLTGKRDACR